MTGKKTDLALEERERFPEDNVEISGVELKKQKELAGNALVTKVIIKDERGSRVMKKDIGSYLTVESSFFLMDKKRRRQVYDIVCRNFKDILSGYSLDSVLVVGLGNREVTSDSLGPLVAERILATRHLCREYGKETAKKNHWGCISAIAPGVMGQTGMEAYEVLKGLIEQISPTLIIAVDALASRSVKRLCTTIQFSDTGIAPGAGVGNHRMALNKKELGIPVIAVGVPTVVDASTIIGDHLEKVLFQQGLSQEEIESFFEQILIKEAGDVIVTPKNIDESISIWSKCIANVLNNCLV